MGIQPHQLNRFGKSKCGMALIMTVYNMKRATNILGIEKLLEKLKAWKPDYKKVSGFAEIHVILRRYSDFCFLRLADVA